MLSEVFYFRNLNVKINKLYYNAQYTGMMINKILVTVKSVTSQQTVCLGVLLKKRTSHQFQTILTLCMLGKNFSRRHFEIFLIFSRKKDLTLHAMETICFKCQILFSSRNKKNIISLSSAETAYSVVSVKTHASLLIYIYRYQCNLAKVFVIGLDNLKIL